MEKYFLAVAAFALSFMLFGCAENRDAGIRTERENAVEAALSAGIEQTNEETSIEILYSEDILKETEIEEKRHDTEDVSDLEADVDLTKLSSTMVYSEVYAMMTEPEMYMGKTIKMQGTNSIYDDPDTGKRYYACIIQDATACCEQGIEYELSSGEAYPEADEDITVIGKLDKYDEDGIVYYVLKNSVLL